MTYKTPPGLNALQLFRLMPELRANTLQAFTNLTGRFGHVVRFKGLWTTFIFTHPDDIERVLQSNAGNYHKGRSYQVMKSTAGNGLFVSEGEFWRRQRRLAQPAFHRKRIAGFAIAMTTSTEEMLEVWHAQAVRGEPVEVFSEMSRLTLRIVGKTLFSTDLTEETEAMGRMVEVGQEHTIRRMWQVIRLPESIPTKKHRAYHAAMREGDRVVYDMIGRRRSGEKADADDLLAMLMSACDEEGGDGMSDKQLRDEAFTIMVAGNETTALALAWTWYLLARHTTVEQKLHAELDAVLNSRTPNFEDLANLTYTRMVIQEALRLYPPAWVLGRTSVKDDEVGGYRVPAKSEILIFPYITQRHPDFWERAEEFDPERFAPERSAAHPRYAYFPFGGGPRQCIGNNFAMMEAQLILATIAQRYQLRAVSNHAVEPVASVTLRPHRGIVMNLHKR